MSVRQIDKNYHVTGQISPTHVSEFKNAGYSAIVCMRPDNEGFSQPSFAEIKAEADKCGMECYYLPVNPGSMPLDHAASLKKILKSTTGPVLAYCASGNRATVLYKMAQQTAA